MLNIFCIIKFKVLLENVQQAYWPTIATGSIAIPEQLVASLLSLWCESLNFCQSFGYSGLAYLIILSTVFFYLAFKLYIVMSIGAEKVRGRASTVRLASKQCTSGLSQLAWRAKAFSCLICLLRVCSRRLFLVLVKTVLILFALLSYKKNLGGFEAGGFQIQF